jgi:D-xylose transport system ATP-binding protein
MPAMMEPASAAGQELLSITGLRKTYGAAVTALDGVDFSVASGEIVALCGDNGAGKSTLVKIIAGTLHPDSGVIRFAGKPVHIRSPHDASALGIATVYQDLALCDNLDIAANLFLGNEVLKGPGFGLLRRLSVPAMHQLASQTLATVTTRLPSLSTSITDLSGGQRQAVAVSRAVLWGSRLVLLDEPTAALGVEQTEMVLSMIRSLSQGGLGVVLISHSLPDIFKVSHRISVLRLGRNAGSFVTAQTTSEDVVAAITGGSAIGGAA